MSKYKKIKIKILKSLPYLKKSVVNYTNIGTFTFDHSDTKYSNILLNDVINFLIHNGYKYDSKIVYNVLLNWNLEEPNLKNQNKKLKKILYKI